MNTFTCSICGREYPFEMRNEFGHRELCSECFERHVLTCVICGDRIWSEDNAGTDGMPLCQDCYDADFEHCRSCGTLMHRSESYFHNEEPYCRECYETLQKDAAIHDYFYKPEPIFHGDGSRFFGVELEIDGAGEDRDNALDILNIANAEAENIYCKHDGSLDDGFEIVTHPMTLAYHKRKQ